MADPLIRHVSDTAFWIAHHRATESERADALFRDPFAVHLAGERGRNIADEMPSSRLIGWTVVIRTCIIDDYIRSAVAEGIDTIINLGAGLDARPYRMDLPSSVRWVEADYAHIIDCKQAALAGESPRCRLEQVKIDLADRKKRKALLGAIDAQSRGTLILTEGVVPYLSNGETGALADDLRQLKHARSWVVDYFSPDAMKFRRRHSMGPHMQNAPFLFDPDDWHGFFREHGWQARENRYLVEESEKLGRAMPVSWPLDMVWAFWSLFLPAERREEIRRFAGYALLAPC